ncbi:MAG: HDOD domain-containing protein [Gammaproteobacteria bacterium]|nr:HDOD domain-containing protein [Gammaproteobacteria bacterium]
MLATDDFKTAAFEFVQSLAADLSSTDLELPGFPDVVMQLHQALGDENCAVRDLVKLINSEPVLAARLIQLANSAAFSREGAEASDLQAAVRLLGFNVVRSTATSFAMQQMQQQEWLAPVKPVLKRIWRRSNAVAAICYTLAKHVDGVKPDEALVAGLFHQLGNLYLLTRAHQDGLPIASNPDWEDVANAWHPTIARAIVENWGMAQHVGEAMEYQDAFLEEDTRDLSLHTRLLSAAKLYDEMCNEANGDEADIERILTDVMLSGKPFLDLVADCQEEIESMGNTIT